MSLEDMCFKSGCHYSPPACGSKSNGAASCPLGRTALPADCSAHADCQIVGRESCTPGCGGPGQEECPSLFWFFWFLYYIVAQPIVLIVYCCTRDQSSKGKVEDCPNMGIALVVGTCVCGSPCVCGFLCAGAEPLFKRTEMPQMPQAPGATYGVVANPVVVGVRC